jgi:hypothetical protein
MNFKAQMIGTKINQSTFRLEQLQLRFLRIKEHSPSAYIEGEKEHTFM